METRTVKLYRFYELNKKAQKKIVLKNIDMFLTDFNFYADNLKDLFMKDLKKAGFYVNQEDINYSGFCNQGDGLSFTCNNINTAVVLAYAEKHGYEKEVRFLCTMPHVDAILAGIHFYIVRTVNRYVHPYSVTIREKSDETLYMTQQMRYIADKLYALIEQVRIDLCNKFYNELEQEFYYIQSFDYVFDWFSNCNKDLYFKDGRRWVEGE